MPDLGNVLKMTGAGDKQEPVSPAQDSAPGRSVVRARVPGGHCVRKAGLPEEEVGICPERACPSQPRVLVCRAEGKHVPERGFCSPCGTVLVTWRGVSSGVLRCVRGESQGQR